MDTNVSAIIEPTKSTTTDKPIDPGDTAQQKLPDDLDKTATKIATDSPLHSPAAPPTTIIVTNVKKAKRRGKKKSKRPLDAPKHPLTGA